MSLTKYVKSMFEHVHPSWKSIILSDDVKPVFLNCLKELEKHMENYSILDLCPHPEDVLKAFTYFPVKDLRVVIVGQDPYPKKTDAMGLSFSTKYHYVPNFKRPIPQSLKNIFECQRRTLGINNTHSSLSTWAEQGVLLLNRSLTTVNGQSNVHKFWTKFTDMLIQKICEAAARYDCNDCNGVIFMLWGNDAQSVESCIDTDSNIVMKWRHPSPMAQARAPEEEKFINCDHFVNCNALLEEWGLTPIDWRVSKQIIAYTDGAAMANGQRNAQAGYGIYFPNGITHEGEEVHEVYGRVSNQPLSMRNGWVIEDFNKPEILPTNNRGELQGFIYAYQTVIKYFEAMGGLDNPEVTWIDKHPRWEFIHKTDSTYCMGIVTGWMLKWEEDGIIDDKANPDLTRVLLELVKQLHKFVILRVEHVPAAHDFKVADRPKKEDSNYDDYHGNTKADSLAHEYKKLDSCEVRYR